MFSLDALKVDFSLDRIQLYDIVNIVLHKIFIKCLNKIKLLINFYSLK